MFLLENKQRPSEFWMVRMIAANQFELSGTHPFLWFRDVLHLVSICPTCISGSWFHICMMLQAGIPRPGARYIGYISNSWWFYHTQVIYIGAIVKTYIGKLPILKGDGQAMKQTWGFPFSLFSDFSDGTIKKPPCNLTVAHIFCISPVQFYFLLYHMQKK